MLLEQTRKLNNIYYDRWMSPKNWIKLIQKHFDIPEDIKPPPHTLAYGVNGYYNRTLSVDVWSWAANHIGFYACKILTRNGQKVAYCLMPTRKEGNLTTSSRPTIAPANIDWEAIENFDVDDLVTTRKRGNTMISVSQAGSKQPSRSSKDRRLHKSRVRHWSILDDS